MLALVGFFLSLGVLCRTGLGVVVQKQLPEKPARQRKLDYISRMTRVHIPNVGGSKSPLGRKLGTGSTWSCDRYDSRETKAQRFKSRRLSNQCYSKASDLLLSQHIGLVEDWLPLDIRCG